jgi:hypothetical protein
MGRGKQLSDFEQGRIVGLRAAGKGFSEIGKEIGRSWHVVRDFLENPASYGTTRSPERPKAVTPRDERRIG